MPAPHSTPPAVRPSTLKPRLLAFRVLLVIMLLWIGALIGMYVSTVHNQPAPTRQLIFRMPAEPSAPTSLPAPSP